MIWILVTQEGGFVLNDFKKEETAFRIDFSDQEFVQSS